VLGANGVHHLADGRIEGEVDPLATYGERAADHLRRLDGFTHVGDLLVISTFEPELGEVAAFEELVGSHGGMGGPQTQPFLLHPVELEVDESPIVGAPAVHRQLRRWAEELRVNEAGPEVTTPDETGPPANPRALGLIGLWQALLGGLLVLVGLIILWAELAGEVITLDADLGSEPVVVTVGLLLVGGLALAAGVGIWRRKRWAWMLTLLVQGFSVLQVLLALASGGFEGLISFGLVPALVALGIFYYLTRPHVMAAFRPRR
jgi:hypothetical protein